MYLNWKTSNKQYVIVYLMSNVWLTALSKLVGLLNLNKNAKYHLIRMRVFTFALSRIKKIVDFDSIPGAVFNFVDTVLKKSIKLKPFVQR